MNNWKIFSREGEKIEFIEIAANPFSKFAKPFSKFLKILKKASFKKFLERVEGGALLARRNGRDPPLRPQKSNLKIGNAVTNFWGGFSAKKQTVKIILTSDFGMNALSVTCGDTSPIGRGERCRSSADGNVDYLDSL